MPEENNHEAVRFAMKVGYDVGYTAAMQDAQLLIQTAEEEADRWYFIANNPQAVEAEKKRWLGLAERISARQELQQKYAVWDHEERQLIKQAKEMILAGHDNRTIATTLGLYDTIVTSIRSGVVQ